MILQRSKIAIIGGGAAGISAAHYLSPKHDITIFDKNSKLGGHANPFFIEEEGIDPFFLDTAFLIFNKASYPLFSSFLDDLNIKSLKVPMSIGIRNQETKLSYSVNNGVNGFIADKKNIFNLDFIKMFFKILKFQKEKDQRSYLNIEKNIKDFFYEKGDQYFYENFIVPLGCAVWSIPREQISQMPTSMFFSYFINHRTLDIKKDTAWRSIEGSSNSYLEKFEEKFNGKISLNSTIHSIKRNEKSVIINLSNNQSFTFDYIILATHANQALQILGDDATPEENQALSLWSYHKTKAFLHSDESLLAPNKLAQGSWNITVNNRENFITYDLNKIHNIKFESKKRFLLTLGREPNSKQLISSFEYSHPVFTIENRKYLRKLKNLNGHNRTFFSGSYFGNGFHEDCFRASFDLSNKFFGVAHVK